MALSETNVITVANILGITVMQVDQQLAYMGARFTAGKQTVVEAQIVLWNAGAGTKTVKIHPKESNMGVETDPYAVRGDIRRIIALILELADLAGGSQYTSRLVRG